MNSQPLNIVILGLSLSSSWGNGHATTYRSLVKGLYQEGHQVIFLERDVPWYAAHRDLTYTPHVQLLLYESLKELKEKYAEMIRNADLVVVGSYVPEGVAVGEWVVGQAQGIAAFYDIDTPITLAKLKKHDFEYINLDLIPQYDLYLSFTGGPTLTKLEKVYKAPSAKPLYCSVDTDLYFPESREIQWQMGYLGTYSIDRQPTLNKLMLKAAKEWPEGLFIVAGPQYPPEVSWPANVEHIEHLPPAEHKKFYNQQRFTLNVTREAMIEAGFAPSVRLFEAAACGIPIISDYWNGLETFFRLDQEILIVSSTKRVLQILHDIPEEERIKIGRSARERILNEHSSRQRAKQLAQYVYEIKKVTM